jgi:cytochrome P450
MEFIFVFCFLLLLFLVVKVLLNNPKPKISKHKLPPGPTKLPFVGNIHQLFGSLLHHTLWELAKKYGPIMHLQLGQIPIVVVSSPEIVKEIFQTHDLIFSNRPYSQANWTITYNHSDITFAPYGDLWRQLRKICTLQLFTTKRVKTFGTIREDEVFNMITSIISEEGQVVNLSRKIFSLSYTIIARAAFGKRSKYQDEFIASMETIVHVLGSYHISDMFPSFGILQFISGYGQKLKNIHNRMDKVVGEILTEHKENFEDFGDGERKEDLVDILLNIQKHGETDVPLKDDIIKGVIFVSIYKIYSI